MGFLLYNCTKDFENGIYYLQFSKNFIQNISANFASQMSLQSSGRQVL